MPLSANSYFTGRTPISVGPSRNPGADLEAFIEQATLSLTNGEVDTTFLVNVVSPWVNVLASPIDAPVNTDTDSSTAFATAIAVAKAFSPAGCEVYAPRGTYTLDSAAVLNGSGVVLRGQGPQNTVIKAKTSTAATSIIHLGVTDSSATLTLSCGLRDLTVDGNSELATAGVTTWNVQDCIIDNVEIKGADGHGLLMQTNAASVNTKSRRNSITRCSLHDNGGAGARLAGERYLFIDRLLTHDNASHGLWIEGFAESSGTPLYAGTAHIDIASCNSYLNGGDGYYLDRVGHLHGGSMDAEANDGWGMEFDSSHPTATIGETGRCRIDSFNANKNGSGGYNVLADADAIDVSFGRLAVDDTENLCDLDSVGVALRGVQGFHCESMSIRNQRGMALTILEGTPYGGSTRQSVGVCIDKLIAEGNGDGSAASNHGVYVQDSSEDVVFGYVRLGNGQTSGSDYEVKVDAGVVGMRILSGAVEAATGGNEFSVPTAALPEVMVGDGVRVAGATANPEVASANAVLDLPVWGSQIEVTGTTGPITGLSPSWPGRLVTLRSTAGGSWPTLSDSATAKLASAFTPASDDDTITLSCDGVVWREAGRSVN